MSDSYNHIFKQSLNAFNNELISGGSSGGEGALIGARGSILGIGTDIGGKYWIQHSHKAGQDDVKCLGSYF